MTWWCSTTKELWSWSPRAYPGIWLAIGLLVAMYVVATYRRSRSVGLTSGDRRKMIWFALGVVLLWGATDWPIGALGAGYLASVHMFQYLIYTLAAAPLLMLGTPEWMIRPVVRRLNLHGTLRVLSRPLVAGIGFNLVLIATHTPWTVDGLRTNQVGSMVLDIVWVLSGLLLWLPIASPLPELRHPSPAVRCVYLFLAAGVVPMVPGGFLTFATFPLYGIYEVAPRISGISATDDQQLAGILMKIGNIPIIWTVIFVIFVKWAMSERDERAPSQRLESPSASRRDADGAAPVAG